MKKFGASGGSEGGGEGRVGVGFGRWGLFFGSLRAWLAVGGLFFCGCGFYGELGREILDLDEVRGGILGLGLAR